MGHRLRQLVFIAPSIGLLIALGCGDGKPSVSSSTDEANVSGSVTIQGKRATRGQVVFDPSNYQRTGVPARTAEISKDGTYTVKTLVGGNSVRVNGPEAEKAGATYTIINFEVQPGDNKLDITLPRNDEE